MTARTMAARLDRIEAAAAPQGRVRVFWLPRNMDDAEAAAWLTEFYPDVLPQDQAILLRWVLPGERPSHQVGEVIRGQRF